MSNDQEPRWRFDKESICDMSLMCKEDIGERVACDWDLRGRSCPPGISDQATILRALNNHDRLLAALKRVHEHVERCIDVDERTQLHGAPNHDIILLKFVKAAITAAEAP